MPSYSIVEPHPTPATPVVHVGRGGSGNISRIRQGSLTYGPTASGPASRAALSPAPGHNVYLCGRGGAGNAYREKERAIFSFDEELAAQNRLLEHAAPVYHVGRGGAGNAIDERNGTMGMPSASRSNSTTSSSSSACAPITEQPKKRSLEGAFRTLSKTFSRS